MEISMARKQRFIHNENSNAICYYRYSSDAQRDCSIEQQRSEAMKYCKNKGYTIIREYEDRAITGTTDERPGYQRMLNEVKSLKPGYLILWKTDRLSRDRYDAVIAKKLMRDNGVIIEYVAEQMPEDEAERVLIEGIEEAIAEHFIIQHRKNVMRGLKSNAELCLYNGHKILGYTGKANEKYVVDESTAPIVRKIFSDYISGKKMREISNELNEMGCKTSHNKDFTEKALWHILHNRAYIGEYHYGEYVIQGGMPAIITEHEFEEAQLIMANSKRGNRGRKIKSEDDVDFWLTGKLTCGICGCSYSGTGGTSKTGKKHYYYTCSTHKNNAKKCGKKNIRKELLEESVLYALGTILCDQKNRLMVAYSVYKKYLMEYVPDDSRERKLKYEIKEVDNKLQNIMNAIEAGIFNETTQQRMTELQSQKKLMQNQLAEEKAKRDNALKFKDVFTYLSDFVGKLSEQSRRTELLYGLVDRIIVYDDCIEVIAFYSINHQEVSFDYINQIKEQKKNSEEVQTKQNTILDKTSVITNIFDVMHEKYIEKMNLLKSRMGEDDLTTYFEEMYNDIDLLYTQSFTPDIELAINDDFF